MFGMTGAHSERPGVAQAPLGRRRTGDPDAPVIVTGRAEGTAMNGKNAR
jgi:hypothetical protein